MATLYSLSALSRGRDCETCLEICRELGLLDDDCFCQSIEQWSDLSKLHAGHQCTELACPANKDGKTTHDRQSNYVRLLPFGDSFTGADRWHYFTVCLLFLEVGKFYLGNPSVSASLLSIYIKDKLQRNRYESLGDLGLAKLTSVPPA